MKFLKYSLLLSTTFFFCLQDSCLQAGPGSSKMSQEEKVEKIQKNISKTLSSSYQDKTLVPIYQTKEIIKTKSYKKPKNKKNTHCATKIDISAIPIQENTEKQETVFKKIIEGEDGRKLVESTSSWPSSVHGVVFVRFPGMKESDYAWGSGTLIASNVVLTAAHNFYKLKDKSQITGLPRFFPAINGKLMDFNEPKVIDYYFPKSYKEKGEEDYGILILDSPLGEETGYFGLNILPPSQIEKLEIGVTGYPGDKVKEKDRHYEMWGMKGPVKKVDENFISYEIDTNKGQSGSSVWTQDGEDYFVIGVHVLGDEDLGLNKATLLTKHRYEKINSWIQKAARKKLQQLTIEKLKEITFDGTQELSSKEFPLGDFGIKELIQYNLPNLTALDLTDNLERSLSLFELITVNGVNLLAHKFPHLKTLTLSGLEDKEIQTLTPFSNLENLKIGLRAYTDEQNYYRHTSFGIEGINYIAQHLTNLKSLNLRRTTIGIKGATLIAQKLHNLTELSLENSRVKNEGAIKIADYLTNLRKLNLKSNGISESGVIPIAKKLTILQWLDLGNLWCDDFEGANEINTVCIKTIAENLINLKYLGLQYSKVIGKDIFYLGQKMPNLETLDINDFYEIIHYVKTYNNSDRGDRIGHR